MIKTPHYASPHVMLIDFGVSRAMTRKHKGICGGTPGYIPPETYSTRGKWFPVGDIFSMGVVMTQMILDQDPPARIFVDGCSSLREIYQATLHREPPIEQVQFRRLARLCGKCLSKDRHSRPRAPRVLRDSWFLRGDLVPPPTGSEKMQHIQASHPLATGSIIASRDISKPIDRIANVASTCPSGHLLVDFRTELFAFQCDVCGNDQILVGSLMYGCRECDFDVCHLCIDRYSCTQPTALNNCAEYAYVEKVDTRNTSKLWDFINPLIELHEYFQDEFFDALKGCSGKDVSEEHKLELVHMRQASANPRKANSRQ